jgi:hypothetical protein
MYSDGSIPRFLKFQRFRDDDRRDVGGREVL